MTSTTRHRVDLLVLDLDNTVWDWFGAWSSSFSALIEGLIEATGLSRATLESEIREVHQRRGTTEYSWLLAELPSLKALSGDVPPLEYFDDATHMQNRARKASTQLYPHVMDTLSHVRTRRVPVVAYTESLEFWTEWRMRRVGLDGLIDRLYSSPDHDHPSGLSVAEMRTLSPEHYGLKHTEHTSVPRGVTKPSPAILRQIISEYKVVAEHTAYVGDSLMKDVAMAQAVGALDVHAKYGEVFREPGYEQLRRVSHWTDEDILREQSVDPGALPAARFVLNKGFDELLNIFQFGKDGDNDKTL